MIKRFYILLLAIVASVGVSYALNPRSGDTWDDNTKTLTVNSNPQDDRYNDQSEIKRLVISSSVTEIGEQAFSNNYNLREVIAYDGLQVIDQSAFFYCPNLESVILPSTLREVRYSVFAACDNLKYVTINASSLEDYAEYAFDDTHADLKIYVPEASVATYKTFWPAYADKFQAIPSSLAVGDTLKVGDAMYSATGVYVDAGYLRFQIKASSLHTISVIEPNGNGKIKVEFTPYAEEFYPSGSYAALTNWFYCYSEYTSGDVTAITVVSGAGTLADPFVIDYVQPAAPAPANSCGDGLTWELNGGVLTISYDGVGTGEMYDFGYEYDANPVNVAPWKENKSEITTVVIGDGVKSIGNYAFNDLYENFTAVTIANSVERIGVFAFTNAKWITEITLPSSLKTIDRECFAANFGFTSITIPSGVTSIGYHAFGYCTGLTSLTCEATTPPTLASGVFYKIRSTTSSISSIPLYVPSGSVAAYEAAAQWNAFDIQGYDPAPATPTVYNSGSVALSNLKVGDILMAGVTLTDDSGSKVKFVPSRLKLNGNIRTSELTLANFVSSMQTPLLGENAAMTFSGGAITITPINEEGKDGNAWVVTEINVAADIPVALAGITYSGTTPASSDEHITANEDPKNTGVYYSTFFDSANKYTLPAGVEAYVAEVSSNALNLTKIAGEGQTIPADNAVILKSSVDQFTLSISNAAPVSFTATNNLHGVDADTEIASVVSGTCYVLSGNSTDGVGFFVYKAPNQLQAHKAYIDLNGSGMAQAPKRMPFVFNGEQTATGVENVQGNVQSTKVIENGVLFIIKNGVKYNAMGQIVK